MATAGSIVVDLIMRTGMFETDTARAEKRLKELGKTAKQAGVVIGTALATAATALTVMTKNAIDSADAMRDMSIRVGVSTETLSAYGYAASQTGTDIETLGKGFKVLAKNAADAINPTNEYAKVFKALGIEVTDAEGKLRPLSELVPEIADRFKIMEDGTTKTALALSLMGRSGVEMIEFMNQGSQGLDEFYKRADALGILIDQDTADAADNFNDTLGDLKKISEGYALHLAKELLPDLQRLATQFSDTATEGNKVKDMAEGTAQFLRGLATVAHIVSSAFEILGTGLATIAAQGVAVAKILTGDIRGGIALYREASAGLNREVSEAFGGDEQAKQAPKVQLNFAGEGPDPAGLFKMSAGEVAARKEAAALEAKLAQALSNPTTPSGGKSRSGGGKSDAERAAEQLQQSYDRIVASLKEQIALTGDTSDMAKLRYDLENGELAKLDPLQKQQLINLQQEADFRQKDTEALQEAIRVEEEHRKAVEEGVKATDGLINDMQFELALLGMTNEERARATALRYADVNATAAQRQEISDLADALAQAHENEQIIGDLKDSMKGFAVDAADGIGTLGEAWDDFFDRIKMRALEFVADKAINALFDMLSGKGTSSGSSGGGLFGTLLGSFSGGSDASSSSSWTGAIASLFGGGRAGGGDVLSGRAYLIGEHGPEMFVPRTAGMVLPADATRAATQGGRGDFNFSPTFLLPRRVDNRTQQQISQRTGDAAREAMRRNGVRS